MGKEVMVTKSVWSSRFIIAAIAQGLLATLLTAYFVLGQTFGFLVPAFSRVIAAGGAGMWFTVGYLSYLIVGVVSMAVTALFYQHIEVTLQKPYKGITNILAWIHLILMNVGVVGATWLMVYGGYIAGGGMLPAAVGGKGWDAGKAHEFLAPLVPPITIFIAILAIGVLLGGLGYVMSWLRKERK
ncbi:MAG: hypothetical protein QXX95_02490 [Nitrososphaerales archaeon]